MSLLRSLSASLLSAAVSFAVVTASGCSTAAVGVDDCRNIEEARCKASKSCGLLSDAAACERYYRDHCLHGVSGNDPAGSQVNECVKVIEASGKCAANKTDVPLDEKKHIELADCVDEPVTQPQPPELTTACMVVERPELAAECAFLLPVPATEEPDGEGGTGNAEPEPTAGAGQAAGGTPAE